MCGRQTMRQLRQPAGHLVRSHMQEVDSQLTALSECNLGQITRFWSTDKIVLSERVMSEVGSNRQGPRLQRVG